MLTLTLFTDLLDKDLVIIAFLATTLMLLIVLEFLKTADAPSLGEYTPKYLGLCQLKQMWQRDKVTVD